MIWRWLESWRKSQSNAFWDFPLGGKFCSITVNYLFRIYFLMGIGGNLHEVIFCQIQQFVPIHCSSMRCWKKYRQKQLILSPIFFFFCIYGFLRIWSVFIPQKPDMIYVDVMGFFSGLLYVIFANEFPMSCWLNKKWKQEKYSRFCKRGTYRGSHLPWRGNRRIRHRASDHQCIDIDLWNQVRDKQIVPFGLPSVGILKCKPKSVGIPGLYSSTVLYSSKAHIHSFFWAFHEAL